MCPCSVQLPPLGLAYCPDCRGYLRRNWDAEAGRTPLGTGEETGWDMGGNLEGVGLSKLEKPRFEPCHLLGLKTRAPGSLFPQAGGNPVL